MRQSREDLRYRTGLYSCTVRWQTRKALSERCQAYLSRRAGLYSTQLLLYKLGYVEPTSRPIIPPSTRQTGAFAAAKLQIASKSPGCVQPEASPMTRASQLSLSGLHSIKSVHSSVRRHHQSYFCSDCHPPIGGSFCAILIPCKYH